MQRKSQLVLELLREQPAAETMGDARNQGRAVSAAKRAVFQSATHHRSRTPVP